MSIGSKIVKGVLGRLTGDTPTPKKQGALPEEQSKEGISRRGMLTGMAATPLVAGALSEIPVQKAVDKFEGGFKTILGQPNVSSEVVSKVAGKIPIEKLGFKLSNLPQMQKALIKTEAEGMGIELDDVSSIVQRKVESFDDLSEKEIGNVYDEYFDAPGSKSTEQELYEALGDVMSDSDLNAYSKKDLKDFIAGSDMLLGDETFAEFINEMRIAGYNDDEISDLIIRSRDRLEDDATSLDDFEDDF